MDKSKNKNHLLGQIFLGAAILIILAVPIIMAIVLKTGPNWSVMAACIFPLITFIAGGIIEVITYSPMLGTSGTYLGFITGNLANLKVPCAVNAREIAGVEHGSKEGEVVSTLSVAVSTIVTTVIIALGVILLIPLKPVLENETLSPAFNSAFTALFAALAYKYFSKDLILVPLPFAIALIVDGIFDLGTGVSIPVCAVVSIIFAFVLFKKISKKDK